MGAVTAVEVWRGLSVDRRSELQLASLSRGDRLSPRRHRWWTTRRGIAEAYATTGNGTPVVLHAWLYLDSLPETPCLPPLSGVERIQLIEVIFP